MLHYGMDSAGYAFPVYFVSWGSGMNVLNSYLMMPFIGIFGVHTWTVRMQKMITACVSLYLFYSLFSRIFSYSILNLSSFSRPGSAMARGSCSIIRGLSAGRLPRRET